jgi:hypothetical protein
MRFGLFCVGGEAVAAYMDHEKKTQQYELLL